MARFVSLTALRRKGGGRGGLYAVVSRLGAVNDWAAMEQALAESAGLEARH